MDLGSATDPVPAGAPGQVRHAGGQGQIGTQQNLVCSTSIQVQFNYMVKARKDIFTELTLCLDICKKQNKNKTKTKMISPTQLFFYLPVLIG